MPSTSTARRWCLRSCELAGSCGSGFSRDLALKLKPREVVWFSWIVYKSRRHRDQVNARVMKDPRIAGMMGTNKKLPFDGKRLIYGGFNVSVAL